MTGLFVVLEGIGGVGKSTVRERIQTYFEERGIKVILTREPGGTPAAEVLREYCRNGFPHEDTPFDGMGNALLFNAARADHTSKVIVPCVKAGYLVLCDRFCDTTFVYQSIFNRLPIDKLIQLHELAIGIYPDMTFLLDAPAEVAMSRVTEYEKSNDQFDRAELKTQERMRQCYLGLAQASPDRYTIINATLSPEEVYNQIEPYLFNLGRRMMKGFGSKPFCHLSGGELDYPDSVPVGYGGEEYCASIKIPSALQ